MVGLKANFIHENGVFFPEAAYFFYGLCGAGEDGVGMSGCRARRESPAFLEVIDDVAHAKVECAVQAQASQQAPRRVGESPQWTPHKGFPQFPKKARLPESGNGHLVNGVEMFLRIQLPR